MVVKPKKLEKGHTIGLIAPSSRVWENEEIRFAIEILESMGFKVKPGKFLSGKKGYLAGEDRHRAQDLNAMFADKSVDAIMALRGGYGATRILPYLDYEAISKNPKALIGYSDITALLNAIQIRTRLVTFHGPIAKQVYTEYTLSEFKKVLMDNSSGKVIGSPPPIEEREGLVEHQNRLTRFYPGKARGQLVGGNLSLICKLLGTPFEPDFKDKILFLEDVGEQPYRIDGMITQLWLSGKLQKTAGIVFGKFTEADFESGNSLSIEEILSERCQELKIPSIRGLMIGHVRDQTTVPLGIEAELDVEAGTLTLLESPVS